MKNDCVTGEQGQWPRRVNSCHLPALRAGTPGCLIALLVISAAVACSPDSGGRVLTTGVCHASGSLAPFTIATYNIHAGVGHDGRRDLERIAETLHGADFVALQEVDNGRVRSGFENQARSLATALGHQYWQHFPAEGYWPFGTYGTAISTSLPIVASQAFELPLVEGRPLRLLAWIRLLIDCRPIHAFVIHATGTHNSTSNSQMVQVEAAWRIILEKVGTTEEPVILLGDFNAGPDSKPIRWLRERLIDVVADRTLELSAASNPDYIFARGNLEILRVEVRDSGASDHPAVMATLRWKKNMEKGPRFPTMPN
ncbi:endonuclease/exonuclease/phosphatase family protein [Petrachloros mirabilis]